MQMKHETDPRTLLIEKIGKLDWFEIANNDVLVATYCRPKKTAGGIELLDTYRNEDIHQGKAALVMKIGPSCDFPTIKGGLHEHDWVLIRPSDGWALNLFHKDGAISCRLICDKFIRARISTPDGVW
jgi:hypothetical protein